MTRVLIVDDHPIFRQGLALALAEAGDLEVCGEGASAQDAIRLCRKLSPDVVLLDLSMPGGGFGALSDIRSAQPDIRVAVLTASEESEDVLKAMRLGASGYVLKGVGGQVLIDAVHDIARGAGYVAPTLAAAILTDLPADPIGVASAPQTGASQGARPELTVRETCILRLAADGRSNKEIARHAHIQEKTVKNHMTRILQKLGVRNRTEAALRWRDMERPAT